MPLGGGSNAAFIHIPETHQQVRYYRHSVAPDFFAAMGIKLLEGRAFAPTDKDGSPMVVAISESTARRFWSNESAVGKRIRLGDATGPEATIVGVVADVRYRDLTTTLATSEPDVYFSLAQRPAGSLQLGVRSDLPVESLTSAVRREVAAIDPTVPLFGIQPLEKLVEAQTANGRFASSVLGVFGIAALMLTAVGLYGVLAFLVSLRRREIGIRIALGATRSNVLREVIGYGLKLIVVGITVGVVIASAVTRWVASQLYGIGAYDPVVFTLVPVVLVAIATFASWLPARRAARVDPQIALRQE
jgi:predicted permease